MIQLTEYRLAFRSGFHLGTRGINLEEAAVHLPSDTLFAALLDALRRMGGAPDDFVAPFLRKDALEVKSPPFTLTSAFPYAGGVRFYPMPVGRQRFFEEETLSSRRKELRRVRFFSEALFRRMLAGEQLDDWLFPTDEKAAPTTGVALQGGSFWLEKQECVRLPSGLRKSQDDRPVPLRTLRHRRVFATGRVPRVTIDRISSASEIYHAGRVTFAPGCGLWFGVAWHKPHNRVGEDEATYQETLARILAVLEDEGIGGERSSGYGAFSLVKNQETLGLNAPAAGDAILLLSRYHPRPAELPAALAGDGLAYDLHSVGGWLRSWDGASQRRKRLWLVREGSVVRCVDGDVQGDLMDVRPTYHDPRGDLPHPVWRYGLALGVGLKEVNRD